MIFQFIKKITRRYIYFNHKINRLEEHSSTIELPDNVIAEQKRPILKPTCIKFPKRQDHDSQYLVWRIINNIHFIQQSPGPFFPSQ
jgi:hypothetical protein